MMAEVEVEEDDAVGQIDIKRACHIRRAKHRRQYTSHRGLGMSEKYLGMSYPKKSSLLFAAISALGLSQQAQAITYSNAETSYHALQQWYNQSVGLWIPSTGW